MKFLAIATFLLSIQVSLTKDCNAMAMDSSCDFYIECLESEFQCGSDGYPIGYGYRYCNKFLQYLSRFAPNGQEWVSETLTCLKQALLPVLQRSVSCSEIYDIAFNSHPDCYERCGFCDLFLDGGNLKANIYGLLQVYEVSDFANLTSIKQVLVTAGKCGASYTVKIMEIIKEFFSRRFLEIDDNQLRALFEN